MKRVLIIAHGHPDLSTGGGEIAAYAHCCALRRQGFEVMFLARAPGPGRAGTPFSIRPGKPQDVLFHAPEFDHFLLSQRAKSTVLTEFRSLLERFRPELVHFHHYVHLGLELLRETRKYAAEIPIVVTLHEFLLICFNQGQMIKTDGRLCTAASSYDCNQCFPDRSPQDFFMRELFIKSFLELVNVFVSPSEFLRQRYIAWGIAPERIRVIENGQPADMIRRAAGKAEAAERLCRSFGFFGQISAFKGFFVLADAIKALPGEVRERLSFEVNGSLQYQPDDFKVRFYEVIEQLADCVRFNGPYRPEDVPALMRRIGWVVVPSVWWENSPLVIQEAFAQGRPVICSDIGGMAEKIRDHESGLHFRVSNPMDLAERLQEAADADLWTRLAATVPVPRAIDETAAEHLSLYLAHRASA